MIAAGVIVTLELTRPGRGVDLHRATPECGSCRRCVSLPLACLGSRAFYFYSRAPRLPDKLSGLVTCFLQRM